ncbi:hypothetical protein QJS04_geneDACA011974 [Acorus gramineus]|uniref:Uncharacterized protein n=1 Tax=Acorus gramineus TaxID=55184 RepID=A0AAV9AG36_ACOGR|nr:hypothetical protein QJS04_geneDACA011974 [Acorus gramineus]
MIYTHQIQLFRPDDNVTTCHDIGTHAFFGLELLLFYHISVELSDIASKSVDFLRYEGCLVFCVRIFKITAWQMQKEENKNQAMVGWILQENNEHVRTFSTIVKLCTCRKDDHLFQVRVGDNIFMVNV